MTAELGGRRVGANALQTRSKPLAHGILAPRGTAALRARPTTNHDERTVGQAHTSTFLGSSWFDSGRGWGCRDIKDARSDTLQSTASSS